VQDIEQKAIKIVAKHNGIATTAQIEQAGLPRIYLKNLTNAGILLKERRGLYTLPNQGKDEMLLLQATYSKCIFSHATALYLHNLTDRTPLNYTVTVPIGYHSQSLKNQNVKCIYVKPDLWRIGITSIKNAFGEIIKTYNKERTICDIIRKKNSTDIQLVAEAIRLYCKGNDKNLLLLHKYAKLFRIERKLTAYMEVLL
jgi:predicted transcriptional regulator of viral defense system